MDSATGTALAFPAMDGSGAMEIVAEMPVRASGSSALWGEESVRLLWRNRQRFIAEAEREEARRDYERTLQMYLQLAAESAADEGLLVRSATLD